MPRVSVAPSSAFCGDGSTTAPPRSFGVRRIPTPGASLALLSGRVAALGLLRHWRSNSADNASFSKGGSRLKTEPFEDRGRWAEAGEGRLQHVGPDEGWKQQPPRANQPAEYHSEQHHAACEGKDCAIDIHWNSPPAD